MKLLVGIVGLFTILFGTTVIMAEPKSDIPKLDYDRYQKIIQHLAIEIGPRPAGSPKAIQATEYIAEEIKKTGYHPGYLNYKLPDNHIAQTIQAYYSGTTNREIILAAHIDTVPESPGANDDASGIALLLELARVIRQYRTPYGVHFIFLGAEEEVPSYDEGHSFSSSIFIEYQKKLGLEFLDGVIMIDKIGVGNQFLVLQIKDTPPELAVKLTELGKSLNEPLKFHPIDRWQDSMPFEDAGLSTAWLEWGPDPNLHTPNDIPDKISRNKVESTFNLLFNFLIPAP